MASAQNWRLLNVGGWDLSQKRAAWSSRGNHEVRSSYCREKKNSQTTAEQRRLIPGALNRYENHKFIINPTSTVVWFCPSRNTKGQAGLARDCRMKVMEEYMTMRPRLGIEEGRSRKSWEMIKI